MKEHLSTIILVLILVVGLSLLLYPTFADWWNDLHQTKAIAIYDEVMANMSDEDYSHLFDAAMEYNRALAQLEYPLMYFKDVPGYEELLNVTGNGVMGYITIEKIGVQLPVYHGTGESVLQIAVGHVEGSSLPTGGAGTHCVLSAHRGLPSARLFTDLDKMELGDTFVLNVIDLTLTYQVDQILIVKPYELDGLDFEEGKDYCTLVTCTPYGINTHRLLVRGVRIETVEEKAPVYVTADAGQIDTVIVASAIAAPVLLILILLVALFDPKKNSGKK